MKFLKENWYKLMTGTAMLIFACGFFIYAVSPSYASYNGNSPLNNDYALVPLNKDGSINIKINEEQMSKMTATQDINIAEIGGAISCGIYCSDGSRALAVAVQ